MKRLPPRGLSSLVAIAVAVLSASRAWSFTVAIGGTDACHEVITGRAYKATALEAPSPQIPLPKDDHTWRHLGDNLLKWMEINPHDVNEARRFMLVSLAIGVRAPDTDGHSLFNLEGLRKLHAEQGAKGQYAHALRGPDDDYGEGDAAAIVGTRQIIIELMKEAELSSSLPLKKQLIKTDFYLDFYGLIDVTVWAPVYYIGRAAHALQDSFSHTIRIEEDGFKKIAHVMNYIDAISYDFKESRDGMAHSDSFDKCYDEEIAEIVEAATKATTDLFTATNEQLSGLDPEATLHFLDQWLTLETGCTANNDFCNNGHWVKIARKEQTGPYVASLFGCSSAGPRTAGGGGGLLTILAFAVILVARRLFYR